MIFFSSTKAACFVKVLARSHVVLKDIRFQNPVTRPPALKIMNKIFETVVKLD